MIKVWVLVVMLTGDSRGYGEAHGSFIIDNLVTKEECTRVEQHLIGMAHAPRVQAKTRTQCIEVWKRRGV